MQGSVRRGRRSGGSVTEVVDGRFDCAGGTTASVDVRAAAPMPRSGGGCGVHWAHGASGHRACGCGDGLAGLSRGPGVWLAMQRRVKTLLPVVNRGR